MLFSNYVRNVKSHTWCCLTHIVVEYETTSMAIRMLDVKYIVNNMI